MRVPMRVPQRVQVRVLQLVPVRVPVWPSGTVSPGCPETRQVPIRVPIRVPELGLVPYRSKSRSGQSQHCGCPESGQVPEWGKSRLPDCPDTGQVPAPRLSKFRYEFRQAGSRSGGVYFCSEIFLSVGRKEGRGGSLVYPGHAGQKER